MTHPIRARLLGLAATVAILTVLIGVPATLVAIGANPIPDGLPTLDQLTTAMTTRDDGTLTLRVLTVAAWLAWAFLAATITLEVLARLRGITAPRLPGLALPQSAARGLVGAAVLLFVAAPTLALPSMVAAPAAAAAPAWDGSVAQTGQSTASAQQTTARQVTSTPPARSVDLTGTHTVTRGESLWSIAATELGDGHRWREVADLNPDTRGPDWVIQPGTVLTVPTQATRTGHQAAGQERAHLHRQGRRHPQPDRARPPRRRRPVPGHRRGLPPPAAARRAAPARPRPDLPGVAPDHPRHHRHHPANLHAGADADALERCTGGRSPRHTWDRE